MAAHLMDIKCGNRTYYISVNGETVYYSTEGRGKGTTTIKGVAFKKNALWDTLKGEKIEGKTAGFHLCNKMGK